ncbi:MAG: DNA-binding transcriptional regulator LsrR, DeoR family [Friedmanniella sp.]|nr:DNA-binding transcriptional regulator LsrR, DeoR family [Friedmanniella sp.]
MSDPGPSSPEAGATTSPAPVAVPAPVDDQLLMAVIAQRYYFDHMTKVDIGRELGVSRFKISRLLEQAVATGLVRIQINPPDSLNAQLSLRLRERFGLERALVAATPDTRPQAVRDALGKAAATLLSDIVTPDDVLGVSSGRTIDAVARHLTRLAGCEVIQLTGMSGSLDDNPVEVLRRVAVLSGGQARSIYAPLTVATSEAAAALKTDPSIAEALGRFRSITIALIAIGSWQPPESRFHDAISPRDRERLLALDVMADVAGVLFDSAGRAVTEFDDRVLGVPLSELRMVRERIVVGGGERKTGAILAALRAGVVTTLITDEVVAQGLLSHP